MNHLCKNTISKKPEAIFFGELEISLQSSIVDPFDFTVEYDGEYGELVTALHEYLNNNLSCTDIKPENVGRNFDLEVISENHITPASEVENDIYYYHTDHLGSSSWITYTDGSVTQYLQNLPFGEPFIDQRATSYDIRYKFTGKEMDSETGYQYFGARYYNSDISVWLSVDPMSDMYPNESAYCYAGWNPVMIIDPNGMYKDPSEAKKHQKEASAKYGTDRVGDVYNANEGTDKEADYRFNVFREGEDKYVHTNEVGGQYQYTPDAVISDKESYMTYNRDAYDGSFMLPATAYDWSQDVIDGKMTEDFKYIFNGEKGTMASRWVDIMERDISAPENSSTVSEAAMYVIPVGIVLRGPAMLTKGKSFLNLSKFTKPVRGTKNLMDPKSKYILSPTRGNPHGNNAVYKLLDKNGRRIGTFDNTGKYLRP